MAKELPKKIQSKNRKEEPGMQTPGQQDYSELIKTSLEEFSITQSMQMAAFFTGKGNDAKTAQQAQSKAAQAQPSILGKSNSIYETLQSLRKSLSQSLSINSKGIGMMVKDLANNSFAIKGALFDTPDAEGSLLYSINENLDLLLKDKFDNFIEKLSIYEKTNEKLFEINKEIRENNEKDIAEAKLKLMIEGIDTSTIDALIKFSDLNLDKLDQNVQNVITFFNALKVLEGIKLDDSLANLTMLGPIIASFVGSIKVIRILNKLINDKDMEAFGSMMLKMRGIFIALNRLAEVSGKSDPKAILKSFGVLGESLSLIMASIPLLLMVNKSFATDNSPKGINLEKTGEILMDFDFLFGTINDVRNITKGKELLKSFMYFNLINLALTGSMSSMNKVNENISKNDLQRLSKNLGTLYFLVGNNLFTAVNGMKPLENSKEVLKSFKTLNKLNKQLIKIVKNISQIDKEDFDEGKLRTVGTSLNNISIVMDIINKMKGLDGKSRQKIATIAGFFGDSGGKGGKKINESLLHIFRSINRMVIPDTKTLNGISNSVDEIKKIIDSMNSINDISKDADKITENLDNYLKVLEESYKNIQEKFEQIIATGDTAEKVKAANEKIASAMESNNETIVKTSSNEKDIKKSVIAIEGMTEFMIGAAIVMSIGALIVMMGGGKFIKAALEFGLVLALFEGLVLMPALIFNNKKSEAFKGIEGFNSFIITCAITMTIGALFMMLGGGKLVKNALTFGITLGLFELIVVAPMLAFDKVETEIFKSINNFNSFIITCTMVMLIGALVVQLAGGKVIKNALKFGVVLMEFEALVVLPFILFGLIKKDVFENAKGFAALLITTTIIFLLGSTVMALSGGKMVKYAMQFAITLMKFEALIIAPFLLFNLLKKQVFDGLKSFTAAVIVCTTVLILGALVMTLGGGKFVKNALLFTGVLALFEALIILPFLMFNKVQNSVFGGLKNFAVVVLVTTTVLILGALFMTLGGGKYPTAALEFTGLLALFEIAIVAPILIFNKVAKDALNGAKDFGIFVALCSFSLIIGAFFIANYGSKPVVEFGIVLGVFVFATTIAMTIFSAKGKTLVSDAEQFGVFVLLSSAALLIGALFITKYGAGSAIGYAVLLGVFVAGMSLVMFLLDKGIKAAGGEASVISEMATLGSFLLMTTASLALGAWVMDKYGWSVLGYALLLVGFIGLMGLVFVGLTYIGAFIAPGAIVAALMGAALLVLTGSLMLINLMFELDPDGKKLSANIEILDNIIDMLKWTFTWLGLLAVPIALGSVAGAAMGVSLLILGGSLSLINLLIGKHGQELQSNIELLNDLLGFSYLAGTYTLLGVLSPLILLGSYAGGLIGVSITILGGALALVNIFMDPIKDTIVANIEKMSEAVEAVIGLAGWLILATIPMGLGLAGLGLMNIFCLGITTSTLMIATSVKKMDEIGDLSKKIDRIINNLQLFIDIPDKVSFGGILGILDKIGTVGMITMLSMPLARTMKTIGVAVSDMANLKVATKWDKEGNPTDWRQLKNEDFNLVINNTGRVLTTMASAFYQAWYGEGELAHLGLGTGGLKALAEDKSGAIWMTLYFGKNVGEVIKGIAEGVGAMAKMQIPIAWDEKGNPIGYRQLKQKDFDLASEGVKTILTNMVRTIMDVYKDGFNYGILYGDGEHNLFDMVGGGLFSDDKPSPFVNTLEATLKIGELIGNIGSAVGNIAKMQIPIAWDEKGKAIRFRTLKQTDFTEMGNSVSTVLTSIITCLANLYAQGKNFDPEHKYNIFDIVSGGWFSSDKPPAIMTVIDASMKVSELVANIGEGIQNMATMQVADRWNPETGKPIHFVKLTRSDFRAAAQSVGDIVTCLIKALSDQESFFKADWAGDVAEAIMPVSDLISNMSDGIIKLASAQVAIEWDDKGHAIKYRKLNSSDYLAAGASVALIVGFMTQALINAATQKQPDGSAPLLEVFEGDTFKNIVEAVSGTGDLISNIADSVIKIGQGLVPDKWDPKDGKPLHYTKIDIATATSDLQTMINDILMSLVTSVVNVYYGKDMPGNKGIQFMIGDPENSPFLLATQGIATITKTVSEIVDSVIKIGSAQIPTRWNKDGKPTWYEPINVNNAVKNIKNIFEGTTSDGSDGLLMVLCSVINKVADKYFKGEGDISPKIATVSTGMSTIIKVVTNSADLLVKIASLNIPGSFDKEGKGQNFHKVSPDDIVNAKNNVVKILSNLLSIFKPGDDNELNEYLTKGDLIKTDAIVTNLTNTGTIIRSLTTQIGVITKYNERISELYKAESNSKKTTETQNLSIGIIRDIYIIAKDFSEVSKAINSIPTHSTTNFKKLEENIDKTTDTLSSIVTSVAGMVENIKTIGGISSVVKFINDTQIAESLKTIISTINQSIGQLVSKGDQKNINYLIQDLQSDSDNGKLLDYVSDNTSYVSGIIDTLITKYDEIYNKVTKLQFDKDIAVQFSHIQSFYSEAIKFIIEINNELKKVNNESDQSAGQIMDLAQFLNSGVSPFDDALFDKFNNLNTSINEIYTTLNKQQDKSKALNANTNALKTYIKAINTVELSKLKPLTTLVVELNKLANKLGNLDKVSDTLANNLAVVLKELVDSLNGAKDTINNAHELQKDRHEQIQRAISNVKKLMDMPLNINVKAESVSQQQTDLSSDDLSTPNSTSSNLSSDTSHSSMGNSSQGKQQNGNNGARKSNK